MPKVSEIYNLYVLRPDLAKEWHPTKNGSLGPKDVTPGSSRKVWWLCEKGHWWQASVRSRTRGMHCSFCKGLKKQSEEHMVDIKPQLLKEWHPSKNRNVSVREVLTSHKDKVWWICEQGHEWEATIRSRLTGKTCPACGGNVVPHASTIKLPEPRPTANVQDRNHPLFAHTRLTTLREDHSKRYNGVELRKSRRYERSTVVMIEKYRSGPLGYVHLRNFSAGGMLLRSDFAVRTGDIVTVKLDKPLYPSASKVVTSRVIWCRNFEAQGETGLPYGIGLSVL